MSRWTYTSEVCYTFGMSRVEYLESSDVSANAAIFLLIVNIFPVFDAASTRKPKLYTVLNYVILYNVLS
jgi:hypothetical protein